MFGVPRSSDRDIGCVTVQINAVPLQAEDFFASQTGVQADHNENIRRQTFDRRKELDDLLVGKSFLILLRLSSLCGYAFTGRIVDDVAIDCGVENCFIKHVYGPINRVGFFRRCYESQSDIIGRYIGHIHMTQGSYNIVFDLGTVVGKGSCSDMCGLHQQPTLTIFSNRGGCSAEGSFFNLTLGFLNLLVEFLGGLGIKSHPLSIGIFNASSEILDAVKCHSPVLWDLLFLSAHSVTSWIFCFTAAVLLFYQTS